MRWDTTVEPGFAASRSTVSVFGVYRDGQMSSQAWDGLRLQLEPVLGARCAIAEGAPGDEVHAPLFAAIDDYARTNGPTDDLLGELAPAAEGDLVLVLLEAGRPPPTEKGPTVTGGQSTGSPGPNPSNGKAGLGTFASDRHAPLRDVFELSASLYSIREHRSVAAVGLHYSGSSIEEAQREFAARLGQLLPGGSCKGWNWSARVDPERIRKLAED
jgi:hypothetical protein